MSSLRKMSYPSFKLSKLKGGSRIDAAEFGSPDSSICSFFSRLLIFLRGTVFESAAFLSLGSFLSLTGDDTSLSFFGLLLIIPSLSFSFALLFLLGFGGLLLSALAEALGSFVSLFLGFLI
jgi:hypothetical protein